MPDEEAGFSKVRYLRGRHGCICGGYKRESFANYPGRSVRLLKCYLNREGMGGTDRSQQKA